MITIGHPKLAVCETLIKPIKTWTLEDFKIFLKSALSFHLINILFYLMQTRLQSLVSANRSLGSVLVTMMRDEGALRPLRGIGVTVAGAGPAHALYFAAYERLKVDFTSTGSAHHNYLAQGAAASAATVLHDGIMTPAEGIHHVSDKVYACSCSYDKSKWSDDRLSVSFENKFTWKSPARYII